MSKLTDIIFSTLVFTSLFFENIFGQYTPFPTFLVWLLFFAFYVFLGKNREYEGTIFVLIISFILSGILSYVSFGYMAKIAGISVKYVRLITLKNIGLSFIIFFTAASFFSLIGNSLRE